jgi:hypothetical protein
MLRTAIDPIIVAALIDTARPTDRLASLSARELDVLRLMAEGLTNSAVATNLHLARRTIEPISEASSSNSICPRPTTTTAEYEPCSPTSTAQPDARSRLPGQGHNVKWRR